MGTDDAEMPRTRDFATYSAFARGLHWLIAALVLVMVPVGFTMTYRGNTLNIWDGLTNGLYSGHKLTGFIVLWLMVGRWTYRFVHGAPRDEPSLTIWHRVGSHTVHWLLYGLLIMTPMLGWIGVSLFPALTIFDLFSLPALTAPNEDMAKRVLAAHRTLANISATLVGLHITAALYHRFIRRDGVFRRMWPWAGG